MRVHYTNIVDNIKSLHTVNVILFYLLCDSITRILPRMNAQENWKEKSGETRRKGTSGEESAWSVDRDNREGNGMKQRLEKETGGWRSGEHSEFMYNVV